MSTRTPLSRARGLGSAHSGVQHFWAQRVTAVALVPLVVWLIGSLAYHAGSDYESARAFFAQPIAGALLLLLIGTTAYHMKLGMQVIVEDYIHKEGTKLVLLMLNSFFCVAVALIGGLAIIKLSFGG
jgi:succinate dehydrogenase / fumarate reductase, membrane anchor subunit